MRKRCKIKAQKIELSREEVLSLVDKSKIDELKEKDKTPTLCAYSLCHEGISTPDVDGKGGRKISFFRSAIASIKKIITKGVNFFLGHEKGNRESLGEIIGDGQKEIGGRLHHIIVGYHPPNAKETVSKIEAISQEAEWDFIEDGDHLIAQKIITLSGVALVPEGESPAWDSSVKMAQITAQKGEEEMKFSDVEKAVREMNIFPSQLYKDEDMKRDAGFLDIFKKVESLEKDVLEKDTKIKKLEQEKEDLQVESLKSSASSRFKKIVDSWGEALTEKQKKFLDDRYAKSKPQKVDDESLKEMVKSDLEEFKNMSTYFSDTPQSPKGKSVEESPIVDAEDYTDPKNNELIGDE